MSDQLDLFEARKARDEGIKSVTDHNFTWHELALARLSRLAGSGREMTGEEMRLFILGTGLHEPTSPHAWGAVTKHACESGLIGATGKMRHMETKKSHARRTFVWRF